MLFFCFNTKTQKKQRSAGGRAASKAKQKKAGK
jgi:hypothetical protein